MPEENPLLDNEKELLEALLREIENLNSQYPHQSLDQARLLINEVIGAIDNSDWRLAALKARRLVEKIFEFRKSYPQLVPAKKSEKPIFILSDTLSLLEEKRGCDLKGALDEIRRTKRQRSLSWSLIRLLGRRSKLHDLVLLSQQNGDNFLAKAEESFRNGNYPQALSYSFVALYFLKEVIP